MYRIYLNGSKYHCDMVKDILKNDNSVEIVASINKADVLYIIYGPGLNRKTLSYWMFSKKPILIHWIGTDTFMFNKSKHETNKKKRFADNLARILFKLYHNRIKFISSAPWLAKEVQEMSKIKTDYLVLTSIENDKILKAKDERDIDFISYIPLETFDLYYGNDFIKIAKESPDKKFCIVCPSINSIDEWPHERLDNLIIQPRTDKQGFYNCLNNSKCFVRMKDGGDAIALSILEALAHGCKVVWNLEFDYCNYETRKSFRYNYKQYFYEGFSVDKQAIDYVKDNYSTEKWIKDFNELLKSIV